MRFLIIEFFTFSKMGIQFCLQFGEVLFLKSAESQVVRSCTLLPIDKTFPTSDITAVNILSLPAISYLLEAIRLC